MLVAVEVEDHPQVHPVEQVVVEPVVVILVELMEQQTPEVEEVDQVMVQLMVEMGVQV